MAAVLPDTQLLIQAGMVNVKNLPKYDPKTLLKDNIKKQLRVQDEQVAVNRYK
jgi:hypothetical protein